MGLSATRFHVRFGEVALADQLYQVQPAMAAGISDHPWGLEQMIALMS
jgi:hypothetical protein